MTRKKILIIALVLVAIIAVFVFRTGGNKNVTDNLGTVPTENNLGKDFISALVGVENVTLDVSLLKSPIFKSLVPSGAYVDPNPTKGKTDPFAPISSTPEESTNDLVSPRDVSFGEESPLSSVFIRVSNITKSTASMAVVGIPQGKVVSLALVAKDGSSVFVSLTYKNNEYSGVATSLKSNTSYTAYIQSPEAYSGLQADFTTTK
jgi:hypothetical protein